MGDSQMLLPGVSTVPTKGWEQLGGLRRKTDQMWRHRASGWLLVHCGHPTALWPYYAVDPVDPLRLILDQNGRGFRDLRRGTEVVEMLIDGRAKLAGGDGEKTRITHPLERDFDDEAAAMSYARTHYMACSPLRRKGQPLRWRVWDIIGETRAPGSRG